MRVTYTGVIAASADDVWARLADVDALVGLLPGANLQRDGDQVVGSLKVRPSAQVTYRITAGASVPVDTVNSATIAVSGTESRGDGTLAATVSVAVREEEGGSGLAAIADIEATGRVAGADELGWSRVLARLGNAVVASFERHPAGSAVPPLPSAPPEPVTAEPVAPEPVSAEPAAPEPVSAEAAAAVPLPPPPARSAAAAATPAGTIRLGRGTARNRVPGAGKARIRGRWPGRRATRAAEALEPAGDRGGGGRPPAAPQAAQAAWVVFRTRR
jgi:carbon monoxide dehydrogenase subunit G